MCERQLMMLDSLGMDWEIVDPWEEKFKELTIFKDQYGHTDVPGDYGPLGRWVAYRSRALRDMSSCAVVLGPEGEIVYANDAAQDALPAGT